VHYSSDLECTLPSKYIFEIYELTKHEANNHFFQWQMKREKLALLPSYINTHAQELLFRINF
jgi:hypothetical protein